MGAGDSLLPALLIAALVVILLLLLGGAVYQRLGTAADFRRHPPPGRLVDVGGHRLHVLDSGKGHPTVVFDAGLPGSVLSWHKVQQELAQLVRVVSYDRAGLGWSDPGPEPRTAERIVEELRLLLDRAAVPGPYILVGHSFGGLTTRLFAARYPDEVAGLVLVDPVGPGEWVPLTERERRRLAGGAKLCRRAAMLGRFGVTRLVALLARAGAHTIARIAVLFISNGVLADTGSTIGPLGKLPADQRAIVHTFWVQAKFYAAMAGQIEALPESAAQVVRAGDRLEGKPVVVISAANAEPTRLAEQITIAQLSSRGRHLVAGASGHWIQLDEPELVTGAILGAIADLGRPPAPPARNPARHTIH
jgi:pimeloyl-ACP methyl ester carboxylesterase